jgi:hypothetical protein
MSLFILNENNWKEDYKKFKEKYLSYISNYKDIDLSTIDLNSDGLLNSLGIKLDDIFTTQNLEKCSRYSVGNNDHDAEMGRCRLSFRKN